MKHLAALHDVALFVEVARTRSFSRASVSLGVPGATLSRRIAAMEARLGLRLFDRTTRRVGLTEAGQRYFLRCEHVVDEAKLAQEASQQDANRPSGHVRLSMPVDLGVSYVGPLLPDFARLHPGVSFDSDLSPHHSDRVGEHIDVAIRLGAVKGDQLVVRRIGDIAQGLFASPGYFWSATNFSNVAGSLSAGVLMAAPVQRRQTMGQAKGRRMPAYRSVLQAFPSLNIESGPPRITLYHCSPRNWGYRWGYRKLAPK